MFTSEGFVNAADVRKRFTPRQMNFQIEAQLLLRAKYKKLRRKRSREAVGNFYCIPTLEEAENEIDHRAAIELVREELQRAFMRYIREKKLFLVGPAGVVEPVSRSVTDTTTCYSRACLGGPMWDFLDDKYLTVNAKYRLKILKSLKAFLAERDLFCISKATEMQLEKIVRLLPMLKQLSAYDGYTLAISSEGIPYDSLVRETLNLPPVENSSPQESRNNLENFLSENTRSALDCFYDVCPNGKEESGLTWKEIEKKSGYSRRSINRALEAATG